MKNRKHRIFIIGKKVVNRLIENNIHLNQDIKESLDANENKQRVDSKRKRLFSQLPQGKDKNQQKSKGKYVYKIQQHIKTESIGDLLKCDLFNSQQRKISKTKQQKINNIESTAQGIKNDGNKRNPQNFNQKKIELKSKAPGQIIKDKLPNRKHKKIFQIENFRQNRVMSTHSGTPRKNIFFTYQSPVKALNQTFVRERRRIFSLDDAPISQKKSSIIQQIRSFIKEQQELEQSKLNQKAATQKEQKLIPLISS